jgi:hypothetical protein
MDPGLLLKNTVSTWELAEAFGLPIVHSTVNVGSGQSKPTVHALGDLLEDNPPDRPNHDQRVESARVPGGRARHRAT